MRAVPTSGTSDAMAERKPNTTGDGRPTRAKEMPTSVPWISAVSRAPNTTARVTAPTCPRRCAFRPSSMGIRKTSLSTIHSPSRRKKNRRNSVRMTPTTAPSAPTKTDPVLPTRNCRRRFAPSTIQPWTPAEAPPQRPVQREEEEGQQERPQDGSDERLEDAKEGEGQQAGRREAEHPGIEP